MKTGYVYGVKRKGTDEIIYVGCTVNLKSRWREHINFREEKSQPIQRYIKDVGFENFEIVVLLEKPVKQTSDLFDDERYFVKKYNTFENGFNGNTGGSDIPFGSRNTNARKVICETTGEIFLTSKEAALKYDFDFSDFSGHLTGRKYKNGIGQRKHGKALFFRYLERESDNREIKSETRSQMSEKRANQNKKPVKDLNTGIVYESLRDFANAMGYNFTSISTHLSGLRPLKKFKDVNIEYIKKV